MYPKVNAAGDGVNPSPSFPKLEEQTLEYWGKDGTFQASIDQRTGADEFVFYDGPPFANGLPHYGHLLTGYVKDMVPRFKTMQGFKVERRFGWDTHGLPVELGVEKELGITKEDIGTKISVDQYNEACKTAVMRYTDIWNALTLQMGYWVDMQNPYVTYQPKYMESVWWLLSQLYNKGLIYKGYTIQPYSPKAGTGLSSHEVNQPGSYRDVTDTTIVAQFRSPLTPEGGMLLVLFLSIILSLFINLFFKPLLWRGWGGLFFKLFF